MCIPMFNQNDLSLLFTPVNAVGTWRFIKSNISLAIHICMILPLDQARERAMLAFCWATQAGRHAEAFSALGEAVRLKRDSWQTWANYAQAASQAGHPLQAARGVIQVGPQLPVCLLCGASFKRSTSRSASWLYWV